MTVTALTKGANALLPPHTYRSGHVDVVLEWRQRTGTPDVDLALIVVGADGQVRGDHDLVFYNQTATPDGSVRHLGRESVGSVVRERARVALSALDSGVHAVFVAASAYDTTFGELSSLRLAVSDQFGDVIATYELTGATSEQALLVGELYRRGDEWKVRAIGQGWSEGMAALVTHFGIQVDDEPQPEPQLPSPLPSPEPAYQPDRQTAPSPSQAADPSPSGNVPAPPGPAAVFRTPPGWPAPPAGWQPSPGWRPESSWPLPPPGWDFWVAGQLPGSPGPGEPGPDRPTGHRRGLFGPRKRNVLADNARLEAMLSELGGLDAVTVQRRVDDRREELRLLEGQLTETREDLARARAGLVTADAEMVLQEVGVYRYVHPLEDAVAYQARLAGIRSHQKVLIASQTAVLSATSWTVNGSARQGAAMVRDFSKLLLRAYNSEADNAVRTVKPRTVQSACNRLEKAADTIARLGKTMSIRVSPDYHALRIEEIRLTADYLEKVEEEKERVRAEREQQRDDERAQRDYERQKERLLKEQAHYRNALALAQANGDAQVTAELQGKLVELNDAIVGVEARAANLRTGWVYVISNVGAFGEHMVKIGLTRRLDPMDRVRELGDASVPFRFDVHALIFSKDAVTLETQLHQALADQRVNQVNRQREFFYASPASVKELVARYAGEHLLEYHEQAEAPEWRASGQRSVPAPNRFSPTG